MAKNKSRAFRVSPKFLIISLVLLGGLVYSLYRVIPGTLNRISETPEIDVISSLEYGPVELDGYITKDPTLGDKGTYLLVTESFNYVELVVNGSIDAMIGSNVHAAGVLGAPTVEGGKPILVVTSMETKE